MGPIGGSVKPYPYGSCSVCGHVFRLCKDGTLWAHLVYAGGSRCPGTHRRPAAYYSGRPAWDCEPQIRRWVTRRIRL